MKRFSVLVVPALCAAALIAPRAFAQHQHSEPAVEASAKPAPSVGAQAFAKLKTLAGTWEGSTKVEPAQDDWTGDTLQVTMRVTSSGHALLHEMVGKANGKQAAGDDNADPISMFYTEAGQLLLTHYCDSGNRPRMVATMSPDGKTLDFAISEIAGGFKFGYMNHVVITILDADHHTEDWTLMKGDKPVKAHIDLHRVPSSVAATR